MQVSTALALTPADADEHPLAQLVGGVGEDDGGVEVAALAKHPEEVGGVEIVEGGGDETAPDLSKNTNQSSLSHIMKTSIYSRRVGC